MHWETRRLYTWQGHDIICDREGDGIVVRLFAHADYGTLLARLPVAGADFRAAWLAGIGWLAAHGLATGIEGGGD